MAAFPYFPFYPADWLSSPRNMCSTLVQQGAYIRLLCACWLSGDCSLPTDNKQLSLLSGLPEQELEFVLGFFMQHPHKENAFTNERLLKEWEKATRLSESRSQAGKKSGKSRRTSVQQVLEQKTNKIRTVASISESESDIKTPIVPYEGTTGFDEFWKAYPKKIGKEAARRSWVKVKGKPSVLEIVQIIEQQKRSDQWLKDSGQFIPNPATWLNQGRWEDEIHLQGALGGTCESRVYRGNFLKPCGNPAVTKIGNRPICQQHKEEYDARRSTENAAV